MQLRDANLFRQLCYINGSWVPARTGATISVEDPATGQILGTVPNSGRDETREAIAAAAAAFADWRARTAKERAAILHRWFELIVQHQEDLATLMTLEQGKPLAESRGEVAYGAGFIEWFAEEAKRTYGDVIPSHARDKRIIVIKEPIGVRRLHHTLELPHRDDHPQGGTGAGCRMHDRRQASIADPFLCACPGRTRRARGRPERGAQRRHRLRARYRRRTHLESGRPEDLVHRFDRGRQAADGAVRLHGEEALARTGRQRPVHRVRRCGYRCGGRRRDRVEVPQHRPDLRLRQPAARARAGLRDFARKLADAVGQLKVGPGLEPGVTQGPLIDDAAVEKVESHIADAVAKGATRDRWAVIAQPQAGASSSRPYSPTRRRRWPWRARRPSARWRRCSASTTEAEAIRLANATEFGLAAYFYGRDIGRIWRVAEALEYGIVGVNTGLISTEVAPFGGVKESGIGREGSKYGIEDYLVIKYLCLGGM